MHVSTRHAVDPERARGLDTAGLRAAFLIEDLFAPGEIRFTYTHYERLAIGGAVPADAPLDLGIAKPFGTAFLLERRELAAVNVGGPGRITVDGTPYDLGNRDALYVGMGAREVRFESAGGTTPARFYLVSTPAHRPCPTRLVTLEGARRLDLGADETANKRTIHQMIVPGLVDTCQLVLGMTRLAPGSVWNTMPAHVHDRRSEVYLYFDLAAGQKVLHLLGEPTESRHVVVGEGEAVLSPPWSIHAGCGTGAYTFIWAMGGDNVDYGDMDPVTLEMLR